MENKERLQRLNELKYMLENHDLIFKKEKNIDFCLSTWAEGKKSTKCLTTACALGSAACYPPFMELGLNIKGIEDKLSRGCWLEPEYKNNTGMDAGSEFFGITEDESFFLFDPEQYHVGKDGDDYSPNDYTLIHGESIKEDAVTALHVANRVDVLIKQYSA